MEREKDVRKVENKIKGDVGEIEADAYLRSIGYVILKKNFKTRFGEIDVIARDGNVIVFVEVKNRTTLAYGRPIEAVTSRKAEKIRQVAQIYLLSIKQPYADCRFDVLELLDGKLLSHEKDAF